MAPSNVPDIAYYLDRTGKALLPKFTRDTILFQRFHYANGRMRKDYAECGYSFIDDDGEIILPHHRTQIAKEILKF